MSDFPNLDVIYLDSACVSRKPQVVIDAMTKYYEKYPACAGRSAHKLAQRVNERVAAARTGVRKLLGARHDDEIIFTRNTTEAINLIVHAFPLKGVVLSTDKEHNSNLVPWLKLQEKGSITREIIPADVPDLLARFEQRLKKGGVSLVAIHHVSNLDGTMLPIKEISKLAHKHKARILVDGAQAAGHMPVDVRKLDVDYYACSGHKMFGPSGTGILYGSREALKLLDTFMLGGDTVRETWLDRYELEVIPRRFEAGLQDYAGIIGLGAAAEYLMTQDPAKIEKHCAKLTQQLTKGLAQMGFAILNGSRPRGSITTITNVPFHDIAAMLDQKGICVRSGMFCVHSYCNAHGIKGGVRFSVHAYTTMEEVERTLNAMREIKRVLS